VSGAAGAGRVLVVDDDPDVLEVMRVVLECAGHAVETATDGRQALDTLRRDGHVCVILLDLMMPVADGWWFRAEVARDAGLARIPIVVVSGAGLDPEQEAALGCAGFLRKPIDVTTLVDLVGGFCRPVDGA
jgi:CheY-like chemotaxis protein